MARELARFHDVTVSVPGRAPSDSAGITVVAADRRTVVKAARAAEVVVAPSIPPYLYAALASHPALFVADMYNPAEVEQAHGVGGLEGRLNLAMIRVGDSLQLRFADIVLCAIEAQRKQMAARIQALRPDEAKRPVLRIVPFGIDNEGPPPSVRRPLRDASHPSSRTTQSSCGGETCGVGLTRRRLCGHSPRSRRRTQSSS